MTLFKRLQDISKQDLEQLKTSIKKTIVHDRLLDTETITKSLSMLDALLALNTVFDFKEDIVVFDTYEYGILHRVLNGMSIEDFESDRYINTKEPGESLGLALALALETDKKVFVVLDDTSLNYGITLESFVQISKYQPNLFLLLVDEQQSLLRHYGAVNSLIKTIRISKAYTNLKSDVKSVLSNPIGQPLLNTLSKVRDNLKEVVIEPTLFKQFGFEYYGPINGHDYYESKRALALMKQGEGTHVLHFKTRILPHDKLDLPRFKVDQTIPESYIHYNEMIDDVIKHYENLYVCTDITKDTDYFVDFSIKYPDHLYTSNGSYHTLINFTKGLLLSKKRVLLSLSSNQFKYVSALIEEQLVGFDNFVILIKEAGLSSKPLVPNHGVYDVGLASMFTNRIFMGRNMNETKGYLMSLLEQESFPMTLIRIPDAFELNQNESVSTDTGSWEILNDDVECTGVIFTYGPLVQQLLHKIRINNLNIWVVNCKEILLGDEAVLRRITALDVPVCIYDLEDVNDPLYRIINAYDSNLVVSNRSLHGLDLRKSSKYIKDTYQLSTDYILKSLSK